MNDVPGPAPLAAPSVQALGELEEHVQHQLTGRVRHFRLSLHDGGLILRGSAHTYYAKQLAQHAVMEACGLPIRANDILVI